MQEGSISLKYSQSPPVNSATSFESSNFESFQSSGTGFDINSSSLNGLSAVGGAAGFDVINGNAAAAGGGGFASSSYESSSTFSTSGGAAGANEFTGGLDTQFGSLGLADASNGIAAGGSSSYESYSSQQTFTQ